MILTDDSGDEDPSSQADKAEIHSTLRALSGKVEDLGTCNDLIAKHGTALQRSLSELESLRLPQDSSEKIKQVNERATLFRITSNAMINVSAIETVDLGRVGKLIKMDHRVLMMWAYVDDGFIGQQLYTLPQFPATLV